MDCQNKCGNCGSHKGVCPECEGKGSYVIYNAYDPDYKKEITCEYCGGSGKKNPYLRSVSLEELANEGLAWDGECAEC